ncbi:hypothetical protein NC652_033915 [Populus alba x Populus x berolinensis]|nr:hypothetical protein NC652_033915 [Populus alba x Populus x berolinensis]
MDEGIQVVLIATKNLVTLQRIEFAWIMLQ